MNRVALIVLPPLGFFNATFPTSRVRALFRRTFRVIYVHDDRRRIFTAALVALASFTRHDLTLHRYVTFTRASPRNLLLR